MHITDIFNDYHIPYKVSGHHHCREGWIQIDCPFCGRNTKKWHMGYSLNGGHMSCWRCGIHSAAWTLSVITGISVKDIEKVLKGVKTRKLEKTKKTGTLKLPDGIDELGNAHKLYLRKRGLNPDEISRIWGVKGIGIAAKYPWSLFVPNYIGDSLVSWCVRELSDKGVRWMDAPAEMEAVSGKEILYGEQLASHAIIICEGPGDCWSIGPGAVATLGLNYSTSQVNLMLKYPVRAVCFDNEPLAQKRAKELVEMLAVYPGETYNIQLDSKDAGSASEKELRSIRKLLNS